MKTQSIKKSCKRVFGLVLCVAFLLCTVIPAFATNAKAQNEWEHHFGNANNNAAFATPSVTTEWDVAWVNQTDEPQNSWGGAYAGHMLLVNNQIYTVRHNQLQVLSKVDGSIIKGVNLASPNGFYSYPTYGDGKVFVPLGNGQVQCFDANTLESLFVTELPAEGLQGLSSILYHDKMIYVGCTDGSWDATKATGCFLAYSTEDKDTSVGTEAVAPVWKYGVNASYYGMGAVAVQKGNTTYVVFAGDDGVVVSADAKTGMVYSTAKVAGSVRSAITYVENYLWVTDKSGMLYKLSIDEQGQLKLEKNVKLPSSSTSTPVVANGKVIVTGGTFTEGYLAVFNLDLQELARHSQPGSFNTPTVSVVGDDLYMYFTINASPDALYMATLKKNDPITVAKLYESPKEKANYSMSNVVMDTSGVLYYGNDAGYITAIQPVDGTNRTDKATGIQVQYEKGTFFGRLQLVVNAISEDADTYQTAKTALEGIGTKFNLYDIHMEKEKQEEVQPSGNVTVLYPIPTDFVADNTAVYRIQADGTAEKMETTIENGMIKAKQDHFSTYAVVEEIHETAPEVEEEITTPPVIPETNNNMPIVSAISVAVLSASTAIYAHARKKQDDAE